MSRHLAIVFTCLSLMIAACGKSKADGASAKGGSGGYAALTADPAPAAITPAEKPPFESVQFQMLAKRNKNGWPTYNAYNLSTKPITYMAIHLYGYDKAGKQVAMTSPPLSWNGKIEPGAKSDWALDIGGFGDPVPASAVTFQLCFSGIKFDGSDAVDDFARCPSQRPMAK